MKKTRTSLLRTVPAFSLVEFIVIISIFAIMAGIALFNFSGFNTTVSLNNLAHDIALTVRQAQVYGISATEADANSTQIRGVYFPYGTNGYESTFTIFVDVDTPIDFTSSMSPEVEYSSGVDVDVDTVAITTQDYIASIATGSSPALATPCTAEVVIAFMRPDPDPIIMCGLVPAAFARITVRSVNGNNEQFINVWPTGQITVVNQ